MLAMRPKTELPADSLHLLEFLAAEYFPSLRSRYAAALLGGILGEQDGFDEEMLATLPGAIYRDADPLLARAAS